MSIGATTFGTVAQAARSVLQDALPGVSVYDYMPVQGFNTLPAIWFSAPNFERHEPDEPDSQLGGRDLHLTYTLNAYVLDNATGEGGRNAEDEAAQLMGEIIGVIDNDPTLGGAVLLEAIVSGGEYRTAELATVSGGQPVVGYEATLEVFTIV